MIPLVYHGPYLSALAMGSSHNRALYKCPITLTLTVTSIKFTALTVCFNVPAASSPPGSLIQHSLYGISAKL